MRGVAAQLNLRFIDTVKDRSYRVEAPGGIPADLPLFVGADLSRSVSDLAYGAFAGYAVQVFTHDAVVYRDEPDATVRTCVLFEVPFRLPALQILPHNRLSAARAGRVDPTSFEGRYRVVTRDTTSSDAILDTPMKAWLSTLEPIPRIEMNGRSVLFHVGKLPPEDVPELVTSVFMFVIRIPDDATVRFGGTL